MKAFLKAASSVVYHTSIYFCKQAKHLEVSPCSELSGIYILQNKFTASQIKAATFLNLTTNVSNTKKTTSSPEVEKVALGDQIYWQRTNRDQEFTQCPKRNMDMEVRTQCTQL
jgi:hypothetical protein